jgi:hypothetical protein
MNDVVSMKAGKDGWRWTRRSGNNAIVGASTEAYRNEKDCFDNIQRTQLPPYILERDGEPVSEYRLNGDVTELDITPDSEYDLSGEVKA